MRYRLTNKWRQYMEKRQLRVVHIAADLYGGAGLGMRRIHDALLLEGVESRILCANARPEEPSSTILRCEINPDAAASYEKEKADERSRRRKIQHSPYYRAMEAKREFSGQLKLLWSPPVSLYRMHWHPWVRWADVVHLHWTAGFLDLPSFFVSMRKAVTWSLRDENPLLGGFHYRDAAPDDLPEHLKEADREAFSIRKAALARPPHLSFTALSNESAEWAKTSPVFEARPRQVFTLPNPLTYRVAAAEFVDKRDARRKLGLPEDGFVVLFSAQNLGEERKGLKRLLSALEILRGKGLSAHLVAIGRTNNDFPLPEGTVTPGFLSEKDLLSWYFAADVFTNPSTAEGCCKTLLDAVACGCPSVAFPHPGAREAIEPDGGFVTDGFSVESLAESLFRVSRTAFDRRAIRRRAVAEFNPTTIARRQLEIYFRTLDVLMPPEENPADGPPGPVATAP